MGHVEKMRDVGAGSARWARLARALCSTYLLVSSRGDPATDWRSMDWGLAHLAASDFCARLGSKDVPFPLSKRVEADAAIRHGRNRVSIGADKIPRNRVIEIAWANAVSPLARILVYGLC